MTKLLKSALKKTKQAAEKKKVTFSDYDDLFEAGPSGTSNTSTSTNDRTNIPAPNVSKPKVKHIKNTKNSRQKSKNPNFFKRSKISGTVRKRKLTPSNVLEVDEKKRKLMKKTYSLWFD